MQPPTDEALMAAVRDGDVEQLGVLFERHHARVHALCHRLTRRADLADDLAQETMLRVLRYRHTWRGEAAFTTWLYRLAWSACQDHWRSQQRRPRPELEVIDPGEGSPDNRQVLLEAALARLDPDQRAVLILSRYDELTYKEIAEVLQCTPGAARVRGHRALNELREIYHDLERRDRGLR